MDTWIPLQTAPVNEELAYLVSIRFLGPREKQGRSFNYVAPP